MSGNRDGRSRRAVGGLEIARRSRRTSSVTNRPLRRVRDHVPAGRSREITAARIRLAAVSIVAFAALTGSASPAEAQEGKVVLELDTVELGRVLDRTAAELDVPGAAVAILTGDGRSWTGATGRADAGSDVAPDMLFEVGSVTKSLTAALILDLAREGLLGLDDPLRRWVPGFEHEGTITVRQLLNHTSGLHNYAENPAYVPALRADFTRAWRPEDSYAYMDRPYFPPGEGWHYSNANYLLLGQVAEAAAGEPWPFALRRRVLEPAGLTRTFVDGYEPVDGARAHAFLDINGDGQPEDLSALVPNTSFITAAGAAGAVVSTARDMAAWALAQWSGRRLAPDLHTAMTTWVDRGDGMQYGLGVIRYVPDALARTLLGHKGNSVGYSASIWFDPALDTAIAVLTNAHAVDVTPIAVALLGALAPSAAHDDRTGEPRTGG